MKKRKILAGILALFLILSGCGQTIAKLDFFAMDTIMSIQASGEDSTVKEARKLIEGLEKKFSVTDSSSELYQINHRKSGEVSISDVMGEVLKTALEVVKSTNGALNPALYPISRAWGFTTDEQRVPTQEEIASLLPYTDWRGIQLNSSQLSLAEGIELDLGAVAKGYASDQCAAYLRENGVISALLDFGGNIYALGKRQDQRPWNIGLRSPDGKGNIGTLTAEDEAIITSGDYQRYFEQDGKRYHHIMDGNTGAPAESGLISVTIICDNGLKADALSTALFVMGLEKGTHYWQENGGFEAVFVTKDGIQHYTRGLEGRYKPAVGQKAEVVG